MDKFVIPGKIPDSKHDQPISVTRDEVNTFSNDERKSVETLRNDGIMIFTQDKQEIIQLLNDVRNLAYDIQLEVLENEETDDID